jgi:excisionase family DNA binding protein
VKGQTAVTYLMPVPDDESTATVHDIRALVYTVPEVARLLAVSRNTAYLMVRTGQIPARRLGTRWVVPRKAFHTWLDATPIPDDTTTLAIAGNWS